MAEKIDGKEDRGTAEARAREFTVMLTVDGRRVELNRFVEGFFEGVVAGMVRSLKGVDDPETVVIELSRRTPAS